MNSKSDLVTAIVHAIEIDYLIEQSIISRLAKKDQATVDILCKDNGALSTFFSKIGLAYALDVYNKDLMEYINVVRRIRNAFAHARKNISFATPQVLDELTTLKMPKASDKKLREDIDLIKRLTNQAMRENSGGSDHLALAGRAGYVILCLLIVNYLLKDQTAYVRSLFKRFAHAADIDPDQLNAFEKIIKDGD